jgi:hypothetical protein
MCRNNMPSEKKVAEYDAHQIRVHVLDRIALRARLRRHGVLG